MNSIMWEEISQDKPRQAEIGQAEQPRSVDKYREYRTFVYVYVWWWQNAEAPDDVTGLF